MEYGSYAHLVLVLAMYVFFLLVRKLFRITGKALKKALGD